MYFFERMSSFFSEGMSSFFSEGRSSYMTCGLKVDTGSRGWARTMSRILRKIRGVSYDLDAEEGIIYISGKVNPRRILRKIAMYGKHAELCWMRTGNQNLYGNNTVVEPYGVPMPMPMPMPPYPCMQAPPYYGGFYPPAPNYHEPMPLHPLPSHYLPQLPYYY